MIYVGTFSKIVGPALRCGWILAPSSLRPKLSIVRDLASIDCADLVQHALADMIEGGAIHGSLSALREDLGLRRDCMLRALAAHCPSGTWTAPSAGLFVWLRVDGVDTHARLSAALQRGIAYVPGSAFTVGSTAASRSALRLSYGACEYRDIDAGIGRLAELLAPLAPARSGGG